MEWFTTLIDAGKINALLKTLDAADIVGIIVSIITPIIAFTYARRKKNKTLEAIGELQQGIQPKPPELSVDELIKQAKQAARNKAYAEAIKLWKKVQDLQPDLDVVSQTIDTLKQQLKQKDQIKKILDQLLEYAKEIAPVLSNVIVVLQNIDEHPKADIILDKTQQFLQKKLTAEQYAKHCHKEFIDLENSYGNTDKTLDYNALAKKISSGNTVLFIGSEIPHEYGKNSKDEQALAKLLAENANYCNFNGTFSSIAEYYQLRPEYGRSSLQEELSKNLFDEHDAIQLYKQLAQTTEPLVIITTSYSDLIEKVFQENNKPHVLLSSIINRGEGYDVGHLLLQYSDKPEEEQLCLEEELSELNLLEQGYSLIYKFKGGCSHQINSKQSDALLISESNYFTFARHADKIIPNYLIKQLIERSMMFIGFSPKSWEDRLLVTALLERRRNSLELCYTANISQDRLQSAYWNKQQVQQYNLNIRKLDDELAEVLA